jgi:hypothetical protein
MKTTLFYNALALMFIIMLLPLTIIVLYGCGGDSGESTANLESGTPVDNNKKPEISYSFPADGQDIANDEKIIIKFSEAVDQDKFWKSISFTPPLDMSGWTPSWSRNDLTFNYPIGTQPFDLNSEYTLIIPRSGVVDLFGNSMVVDHNITFKTLRYPVEVIQGGMNFPGKITPVWLFSVGKTSGLWTVVWGGTRDPGGPAWSTPGGTITASSDGQIDEKSIKTKISEAGYPITVNVSKGNGNSLSFSTSTQLEYTLMFSSTSSYLTFDLRSPGTVAKEYVYIGAAFTNPSRTPFILKNK